MSSASWPPSLTRTPRVRDLTEKVPEVVLRTEMDGGPAKTRRRVTDHVRLFSVAIDLTRSEVATFDDWFMNTIAGGALAFSWKHPRTGDTYDFRIVDVPQYKPTAPRGDGTEYWGVTFAMELLPGTLAGVAPSPVTSPPGGDFGWYLSPPQGEEPAAEVVPELEEVVVVGHFYDPGPPPAAPLVPPLYYDVFVEEEDWGWSSGDETAEAEARRQAAVVSSVATAYDVAMAPESSF